MTADAAGYHWGDGENHHHGYLFPAVSRLLKTAGARRIFDLGCGDGSIDDALVKEGYDVTGVDPSDDGVAKVRAKLPHLKIAKGSAYDDLAAEYGTFSAVISLEVVEHVYSPRDYAKTLFSLVEPGGVAIVSTPYHGYWKNLALAASGKLDAHFTALWDHGHIKFWSVKTLSELLTEAGFENPQFERVGRMPPLAKSMIAFVRK